MAITERKASRKEQILQSLAHMLEAVPGGRITTAALAKEVGVSEAALYRHFPSKAKMFEGLIEFIETSLFSRISRIQNEEPNAIQQCGKILHLLLAFAEKNPGITRILTGDAITGETDRLRQRITQLFDRIETQLKQILRESELKEGKHLCLSAAQTANMILASAEGRICQYVRSGFRRSPLQGWEDQWLLLSRVLFNETSATGTPESF